MRVPVRTAFLVSAVQTLRACVADAL